MTVRHRLATVLALLVLLLGSGCGGGDVVTRAEADESAFQEGKKLQRQGRNAEALVAFLDVIDRRGDRESPESHFEAGLIYLNHIKEPEEAIHHFKRYLYLKPTSPQAQGVRGLIDTARREFAKTLPARPPEEQAIRIEAVQEVEKLRRENEELRAELATLRGGGATPVRSTRSNVNLAFDPSPRANTTPPPAPTQAQPAFQSTPFQPAPTIATPAPTQTPTTRPPAATNQRGATFAGKTHTVAPKETLYGISVKYYGNGRHMEAIFDANRDQMRSVTDIRPGMTLRLP